MSRHKRERWRSYSSETVHLTSMQPRFVSDPMTCLEDFVVVYHLALRVFLQVIWFPSPHKINTPNSNLTRIEDPHSSLNYTIYLLRQTLSSNNYIVIQKPTCSVFQFHPQRLNFNRLVHSACTLNNLLLSIPSYISIFQNLLCLITNDQGNSTI